MIRYLADRKSWILEDTVAYAFGLTPSGLLVHTYFGAPLPHEADYPLPADFPIPVPFSGTDENSGEEYPAWGGFRFIEPCLKADFPDGARDIRLSYNNHTIEGNQLSIMLEDIDRSVGVKLVYRISRSVVERYAIITNNGREAILLEQVLSGALTLPDAADYRLTYLSGRWGAETQLQRSMLGKATHVMESRRGHTSHSANPWCALDPDGASTEERGPVYAINLAYSGNWKTVVQSTPVGQVRIASGIHSFDFSWTLAEGASFETPKFLLTFSDEGFGGASRNMHAYIRNNVLPLGHRNELRPVLYNSWEATAFDVTADNQMRLAEIAAEIGVELFVIDDGWFGARNSDNAGLGDWVVNRTKFPDGLDAVSKRVHELGMKFGLWVEPEMVNPDSDLHRRHPEWAYRYPERTSSQMRNQLVLNFGRPDVQEFAIGFMNRLLDETAIDFIKWDMNRVITEAAGLDLPADRQKETWTRHVQGLYRVIERVRTSHPSVWFEDCSGGGGRIDPGILGFYDQAWISDNTDAFDRLFIQEGYSFGYPANTMVAWVTSEHSFLGRRRLPLAYRFHSAMAGVLGIGDDVSRWSDTEKTQAKGLVALYKEIRPIVQQGSQYRILPPGTGSLAAVLYVAGDLSEGVLFTYLNRNHYGNPLPILRLPGFQKDRLYEVESGDGPAQTMSGRALHLVGVRPNLREEYESAIIRIRAK